MDDESFELRDVFIDPDEMYGGRMAPPDNNFVFRPAQTQREFIADHLDNTDADIDALQKVWSDKKKVHEISVPKSKRRNRKKIERVITDDQREALDEEYYGFFRGAVGMSTLWKSFNENNERQKTSLDDDDKSAWIPWRTLQLYVSQQSTNQLMRDAKAPAPSMAIVPKPDNMIFLKHVQIDSIVLRNARDGRHAYIVNAVDVYTRYSWQRSIMLNAQLQFDQRSTARALQEIIDSIRDKYGPDAIPRNSQWQTDQGGEYKAGRPDDDGNYDPDANTGLFKREVEKYEPKIKITYARSRTSDQQAVVELKNKEWRRVARQVLFNRDQRDPEDKLASNTNWYKKWYGLSGRHGRIMAEINAILNSIPSRTLGGISPADFVEALMNSPENDGEKETWKQMVDTANATMVRNAEKRRKESTAEPYEVGDWVRTVNKAYSSAKLRGNREKFLPRYNTNVFRVRRVLGGQNQEPSRYMLDKIDPANPDLPTTSTKAEQKVMFPQSELIRIPKTIPKQAPHDLMVSERPWENEKISDARKSELASRSRKPKYFKSYPFAEFE